MIAVDTAANRFRPMLPIESFRLINLKPDDHESVDVL
jgi:hypothetical protein